MNNKETIKADVAYYMKRLYDKGLLSCSGGNVSAKINEDLYIITPSGKDKGRLEEGDICMCNAEGKPHDKNIVLSMETIMHLAIYKARPDICAVVHAHPPYATAYAVNGRAPETGLSGEMRALLGKPAVADYACMGSAELAKKAGDASLNANVILLKNHGAITIGTSLFEAYDRMEVLEAAAKVSFISGLLGNTNKLSPEQLSEIDNFFSKYSGGTKK